MEVIIRPDADSAARLAAGLIAAQIRTKPASTLGLATGDTMDRVYAELVRMHRDEGLDFLNIHTFNLDEYVGLPADHPGSYRRHMNEKLFGLVNIPLQNTHLPNGMADDLRAESRRYETLMANCGGIDLQLLGIGRSGHIGFNEPLSALRSRTRDKALTPTTRQQNAQFFASPEEVPHRSITMGVGTILEARRLVVLVLGEHKANILARAVEGPITSMVSASAVQLHPRVQVICDEPAAQELSGREYYDWIFQNEPEWAPYRDSSG